MLAIRCSLGFSDALIVCRHIQEAVKNGRDLFSRTSPTNPRAESDGGGREDGQRLLQSRDGAGFSGVK